MPNLPLRIFPIIVPVVFLAFAVLLRTLHLTPLEILPRGYFGSYLGLQAFALFLSVLIDRHFNQRILALMLAFLLSPFFWATVSQGVVASLQLPKNETGFVHHVFVYAPFLVFPLLFIGLYIYTVVAVERQYNLG